MISTFSKPMRFRSAGYNFGGLANVVFVLFRGADAGNAQQVFQLLEKALLVLAGIRNCGGNGCG
jgi:hypothetical protein